MVGGDHNLGGVRLLTSTRKVGTSLHAWQNSFDTSRSSRVGAYQRFFHPSQAWLKAISNAL